MYNLAINFGYRSILTKVHKQKPLFTSVVLLFIYLGTHIFKLYKLLLRNLLTYTFT